MICHVCHDLSRLSLSVTSVIICHVCHYLSRLAVAFPTGADIDVQQLRPAVREQVRLTGGAGGGAGGSSARATGELGGAEGGSAETSARARLSSAAVEAFRNGGCLTCGMVAV